MAEAIGWPVEDWRQIMHTFIFLSDIHVSVI